jgi:hypothetical protein
MKDEFKKGLFDILQAIDEMPDRLRLINAFPLE